ncbi:hypothetical protein [Haloferax sp. ATB1]|uniref:DUF7288 family protein n=1 Tax=Haloferax sp. ATB1 TaxID=1508454 RepID=UPI000AF0CB49|nr:hypothetical protein [Haloferax sp. ATB1]
MTLYDDDVLVDSTETPTNTTLSNATSFYVPDASAGPVYNVVQVEVVAWRL